jgi:hypothetical protein
MAAGNRHLGYKELLNELEARSPGSKASFLFGFLERGRDPIAAGRESGAVEESSAEVVVLRPCVECGAPTPAEVCAFCKLRERARAGRRGVVE